MASVLTLMVVITTLAKAKDFDIKGKTATLSAQVVATFDEPWAMTFLPDGTALVTTKPGKLFRVGQDGKKTEVQGIWNVQYGGQGGLGDVVLHPKFSQNKLVYISSVEAEEGGSRSGAVVIRAKLDTSGARPKLNDPERIWTQEPKVSGGRHFGHRLVFDSEGYLFITSGDRGQRRLVQRLDAALGKIIRLHADGRVPKNNPWQSEGSLAKTFWSTGHRNPLGITLDTTGRLWAHEMGPRGGDELNLVTPGKNYGWPIVSNGKHYSGVDIPDHDTRPDFAPPAEYWVPSISPAGFVIYNGDAFSNWNGDGFVGALSGLALVRIDIEGITATEAERFSWGERIREVEQGPNGFIWVLEDSSPGRLLKLTPAK